MGCNCGKPKCNGKCGCKSPAVLQINNPAEYVTFHKVKIPASLGDSTTFPPRNGAYRNTLVFYEADNTSWMYSSDGIPTNITGPQGPIGPQGPAGTVTVGDTTTGEPGTDASVTNVGTPENAVLNFTIPKGDKGDQGVQGETGPQGYMNEQDVRDVVNTIIPEDYFDGASESCAEGGNVPIENVFGTVSAIDKIYGNQDQIRTSGSNLYNYTDTAGQTISSSYWHVGDNGWISCSCRNEHSGRIDTTYYTNNLNLKTSTQYAVVLEVKEVHGSGQLALYSGWAGHDEGQFTTEQVLSFSSLASGGRYVYKPTTYASFSYNRGLRTYCRFDSGQNGSITFRISVMEDTTVNTNTFKYEAFSAEEKTPSPSFPQPVLTVTDKAAIRIIGKNLFDKNNANVLSAYIESSDPDAISPKYASANKIVYIPCHPNTTYTVQKGLSGTDSKNRFRLATASQEPYYNMTLSDYWSSGDGNLVTSHTITTNNTARYLLVYCYSKDTETTFEEMLSTIQIELGSQATSYSSYTHRDYPITLNDIKLGSSDYIYESNGQFILHKENGYNTKDINILGIDSNNSGGINTQSSEGAFSILASDWGADYSSTAGVATMSSNIGVYKQDDAVTGNVGARAMEDGTFCQRQGTNDRVYFRNTAYIGKTGLQVRAILQSASGGTNFWYPLPSPVETEVDTEPLLSELKSIRKALPDNENVVFELISDVPSELSVCAYSNNLAGISDTIRNTSDINSMQASVIFPIYGMDGPDTLGDCSIIKNGDKTLMIDTFTNQDKCYQEIKDALAQNNIESIDYLVITHYHGDHIGNVLNLIADGYLNHADIYLPRVADSFPDLNGSAIKNELTVRGLSWIEIDNQVFNVGDGCCVRMLNGSAEDYQYYEDLEAGSDNNSYNDRSVVCDINLFGKKLLFTGDLEYRGCEYIATKLNTSNYDLLKDMHHGFINNAPDFCAKVNPDFVIIPASAGMVLKNYSDWLINSAYWLRKTKNVAIQGYQKEHIVLNVNGSGITTASDVYFANELGCRGTTYYTVDYDNANEIRTGSAQHPFSNLNEAMIFLQKNTPNQIVINIESLPSTNRSVYVEGFKWIRLNFNNGITFDNDITISNCTNAVIYNLYQTTGTLYADRSNLFIENLRNSGGARAIEGMFSNISLRGTLALVIDTQYAIHVSYNSQLAINTYTAVNITFAAGSQCSLLDGFFATIYLSQLAKPLLSGYTASQIIRLSSVPELILNSVFDDIIN